MRKRANFFCLVFVHAVFFNWSQTRVCGKVTSDSSGDLPRARIQVTDLKLETMSNEKGNFCLVIPAAGRYYVYVSKDGFRSFFGEMEIVESTSFDFVLKRDLKELDEVVVYGNQNSKHSETANTID